LAKNQDQEQEKQVRDTILRVYEGFEQLDADVVDQNYSHDDGLLAFGSDWDEKFSGWKQYRDVHTVQFKALKRFKFTSRELEVHVDGAIAWVADRPHWEIETKAGEEVKDDVRVTAVLRRDGKTGRWLIVQWHVSAGLKERMHEY
jgi:ketosteroid isomerase-like protein